MKSYDALVVFAVLFLLCMQAAAAATEVLSGDGFTSAGNTIHDEINALGRTDGLIASIDGNDWRGGETAVWTISEWNRTGTITSVRFSLHLNSTGFGDDSFTIQYSNNSGVSWTTVQTGVRPPSSLTYYGNYTVTSSFSAGASLNGSQVRVVYTQNGGPDRPTTGFDGTEFFVEYTPPDITPPTVSLSSPKNTTWVNVSMKEFAFVPSDDSNAFANCSLYIDGTINQTNTTPIIGGQNNTILASFGDGAHYWSVACYDISGNRGESVRNEFNADTLPPIVTLLSPPDNAIISSSDVTFTYNISDARNIDGCTLYIDEQVKGSANDVPLNTEVGFTVTVANGDHDWYISCTDETGHAGISNERNVSIQVLDPTIVSGAPTYVQGDDFNFTGENWQAEANVSITLTLPNGSKDLLHILADPSGDIKGESFLDFDYPVGIVDVVASQVNDSSFNASTTFILVRRIPSLITAKSVYIQGNDVLITGKNFAPATQVNLVISFPGGTNITPILSNSTGGFNFTFLVNETHPVGIHEVNATNSPYPNLNATTTFTVVERIPGLSTNATTYTEGKHVGIEGREFSGEASVVIQIYNTVTGKIGPFFPVAVSADTAGDFSLVWNVNNTCSGNYTVTAEDQNVTSLEANTTFLIDNKFNATLLQAAESITANRVSSTVGNVNQSDDIRQSVGLTSTVTDGYLEFGFFPAIPSHAEFKIINITVEHVRTSTKVSGFQMYLNDVDSGDMTLLSGTGCSGAPPDTEGTTTCDITSAINGNITIANNLRIRLNYTRSSQGGGGDVEVDFAAVEYSWTGDKKGCFEFGSDPVPPSVFSVATESDIVLNAGTIRSVQCNFTVSDGNGADDILGANATFFIAPSQDSSQDNNRTKYTNSSCEVIGSSINSKDFTCTTGFLYYAQNGTWTCNATGIGIDGYSSAETSFQVDPLYAINVTNSTLDFGQVFGGSTSSTISENITNLGNIPVDVSVYGYGSFPGDGNSFVCQTTNISIENTRFAAEKGVPYISKTPLSGVLVPTGIRILNQIGTQSSQNVSYWQTMIPRNVSDTGICLGTIVFHATGT